MSFGRTKTYILFLDDRAVRNLIFKLYTENVATHAASLARKTEESCKA